MVDGDPVSPWRMESQLACRDERDNLSTGSILCTMMMFHGRGNFIDICAL